MNAFRPSAPELDLLLTLMSPPGAPPAVAAKMDWPTFIACVNHHRVALRLTVQSSQLPEDVRRQLGDLRRQAVGRGLLMSHALAEIAKAFRADGVPMLAIKGPALAALFYGDPLARQARDLDLVVDRHNAARARSILIGLGYAPSPVRTEPECLEYVHSGNWPPVELHTALSGDDRLLPSAVLRPFEQATQVTIAGQEIDTLAPEAASVYAAVHGCRHLWARLSWVADLAAASRCGMVDWGAAFVLARRMGVERHLALGLVLARDCLAAPVPDALATEEELLARAEAATYPLHHVLTIPPLRDRDAMYQVGLLRSLWWGAKLYSRPAGRLAVLQEALSPTEDDRRLVQLPPSMSWLYFLLRIPRILLRRLRK